MARKIRVLRQGTILPGRISYEQLGDEIVISDSDFRSITRESFAQGYVQDLGAVDAPSGEMEPATIATMVMDKLQPTVNAGLAQIDEASKLATGANEQAVQATSTVTRHRDNVENPHGVTPEQLGLDRVDNTRDVDKPLSGPQKAALDAVRDLVGPKASQAVLDALSARVKSVEDQLGVLGGRTTRGVGARVAVPAFALGKLTQTVPVTWNTPAPAVPTAVWALVEPVGSLLGSFTVTVQPGSVTVNGCTLVMTNNAVLGLGNGFVNVLGAVTT